MLAGLPLSVFDRPASRIRLALHPGTRDDVSVPGHHPEFP